MRLLEEKDAIWVTQGAASHVPTDFCNIHVGSGVSPYEQAAWQAATDAAAAQASGDAAAAAAAQARFEEANRKLQESKGLVQPSQSAQPVQAPVQQPAEQPAPQPTEQSNTPAESSNAQQPTTAEQPQTETTSDSGAQEPAAGT